MSRTVLVPHDGGESADAALSFALSEYTDTAVTVLHVVEPFPDHIAAGRENHPAEWRTRANEHAETVFERARKIAADHDAEIRTEWVYGRPSTEIVTYVEENEVDVVVMGSHGKGAITRLIFGSVAESVVRHAPATVTVVRE